MAIRMIEIVKTEEDVARRLLTALAIEWDKLPKANRDNLIREAVLAFNPETKTTSLDHDVTTFLRKHAHNG